MSKKLIISSFAGLSIAALSCTAFASHNPVLMHEGSLKWYAPTSQQKTPLANTMGLPSAAQAVPPSKQFITTYNGVTSNNNPVVAIYYGSPVSISGGTNENNGTRGEYSIQAYDSSTGVVTAKTLSDLTYTPAATKNDSSPQTYHVCEVLDGSGDYNKNLAAEWYFGVGANDGKDTFFPNPSVKANQAFCNDITAVQYLFLAPNGSQNLVANDYAIGEKGTPITFTNEKSSTRPSYFFPAPVTAISGQSGQYAVSNTAGVFIPLTAPTTPTSTSVTPYNKIIVLNTTLNASGKHEVQATSFSNPGTQGTLSGPAGVGSAAMNSSNLATAVISDQAVKK